MTGKEGQLATDLVLDALFGHALVQGLIRSVMDLLIVLATANVTAICGYSDLRLDRVGPDHNGFHDH